MSRARAGPSPTTTMRRSGRSRRARSKARSASSMFFSAAIRPTASSTGVSARPAIARAAPSLRAAGVKRSVSTPRPTTVSRWKPAAPSSRRRRLRRHEGAPGQVVEAPHQAERRPGEQAEPVVPAVLVEIGAEIGGGGDAERARPRRAPPRAAAPASPGAPGRAGSAGSAAPAGRRGPGRSAGRDTSESTQPAVRSSSPASSARFAGLARPDQLDEVAARAQEPNGPLDGERDAVELGRPGFGDVGDAHRAAGVERSRRQAVCPAAPPGGLGRERGCSANRVTRPVNDASLYFPSR